MTEIYYRKNITADRGVSGSEKSNGTDDPNQSKPKKNRILWFGSKTEPNQ
jgi:hypothetical protein